MAKVGQEASSSQRSGRRLSLILLGKPQILWAGEDRVKQIKYRKGLALLGYLAAHAGLWQPREKIADLFWPDLDLAAARTNLRQVLNNLTSVLNISPTLSPLEKDDKGVVFHLLDDISLDSTLLSDAVLNRIVTDDPAGRNWREKEVEPRLNSLGGEFLEGLTLADTPEFDIWLETARIGYRAKTVFLLDQVCKAQQEEGRLGAAIATARRLMALVPLDEEHAARLMTLSADSGDVHAALEVYETLRGQLESELGTVPAQALVDLKERLESKADRYQVRSATALMPEMRWLVALYCNFRLSPEDIVNGVEDVARVHTIVQQRGGWVVATAGRGLLAAFGFGGAVEKAAERAFLAANDIISSATATIPPGVGVAAGHVLFRTVADVPHLLGDVPDLATLIGWSAAPGEVLATAICARQAGEAFQFHILEEREFSGIEGKQSLQRLVGMPPVPGDAPVPRDTPFAGRREEMAALHGLWQEVCAGQSRITVLRAPAGMGKTRLAGELAQWVTEQGGAYHRIICRFERQHQPLAPILAGLEHFVGLLPEDDIQGRTDKIVRFIGQHLPGLGRESVDALVALVGSDNGLPEDPLLSKSTIFAAIIELAENLVAQGPTLLIIDDLHWADLATQELLSLFIKGLKQQKLLLAITTRPEVALDCPVALTQVFDLAPLAESDALSLVQALDGSNEIPAAERARIAASGGVPLFLEHMVKGWREGEHHLLPIAELLQSELDRLGPAKDVLRAAAVLGNQFNRQTLVDLMPGANVAAALSRAIAQRLVEATGGGVFSFHHALIRDSVYASLPFPQRKALHERVARMFLLQGFQAVEDIARHFSAAECWQEAAEHWGKAGISAMAREFASDAVVCFQEALSMLAKQGKDEDDPFVLSVQMRLGYAAQVAQGFGSPLAYQLFNAVAARIEAQPAIGAENRRALFAALSGCYMGGSSQGKVEGLNIARRLESLAEAEQERLMVCFALGNSLFWRGDLQEARRWQQQGIVLSELIPAQDRIRFCVDDPAVTCRSFLSWNLWFLGEEAAAIAMAQDAVTQARKGRRVHALCFALTFAVAMHWCRGSVEDVVRFGSEALALAKKYGFPLWEGVNSLFLLWAQARSGGLSDTTPLFAAAKMMQEAYQAGITTSRWIAVHALMEQEAYREAEELLDVTIREAGDNEDQYCLADLFWIKARCFALRGQDGQALMYEVQARELAKMQQAKGLLARFDTAQPIAVMD